MCNVQSLGGHNPYKVKSLSQCGPLVVPAPVPAPLPCVFLVGHPKTSLSILSSGVWFLSSQFNPFPFPVLPFPFLVPPDPVPAPLPCAFLVVLL